MKSKWGILGVGAVTLAAIGFSAVSADPPSSSLDSDLIVTVDSVLALSIAGCNSTNPNDVELEVTMRSEGSFSSCPSTVTVSTNAPGFKLSMQGIDTATYNVNPPSESPSNTPNPYFDGADDTNLNLVRTHLQANPTPPPIAIEIVDTTHTISPHTGTITSPTAITDANTSYWGFAIPKEQNTTNDAIGLLPSGFDSTYSTQNDTGSTNPSTIGLYAKVPTNLTQIKDYPDFNNTPNQTTIFYGTRVTATQKAGTYKGLIQYTALGEEPAPTGILEVAITPNIASTITPTGNGTGTNGPQFSIFGAGFGSSPTVTIGGQPCTDITVNSAGTAITCTGPVSGMTDGENAVKINRQETTATVNYDSTAYPALQSLNLSGTCQGTSVSPAIYRDTRDSQLYRVAKLQDSKCWMLDNLKYKPNGDSAGTVTSNFTAVQEANTGLYLTQNGGSSTASPNQNAAKYIDPVFGGINTNDYCYIGSTVNSTLNQITLCGLLYNFYTATAGTAPQSQTANGSTASGSICPLNWRLPTGYYSNGNSNGDIGVLNASMNAGGLMPGSSENYFDGWLPGGHWKGVFGGFYSAAFFMQGIQGYYWSSSVGSASFAYDLLINYGFVSPATFYGDNRYNGYAVRCVL